jgi:hypothetical protein
VALEQEVQSRQADVTGTQQIAQQMTALAAPLAQALVVPGQFAATLLTQAQALATLAPGIHDAVSALQAITSVHAIQQQCQPPAAFGQDQQAWNMVTSLAQQQNSWLLAHWQQAHLEQPSGTPIAMADPLAQALGAYSATAAQLAASIQTAAQFPPVPAPTGTPWPGTVAGWVQSCSQRLAGLAAQISAIADQLGGSLSWANAEATAATAMTVAQSLLETAQRVAAAVAGPVDPASLGDRLRDLTALRVSACPDPITPADRAHYDQRMAELVQALTDLLAAPTGAVAPVIAPSTTPVPPLPPIAMLPVRLETRVFPVATGGTEFRIRIYVDSVHVNAHDPRLTADEAQWAAQLKAAAAGGAKLTQAEWAQVAGRFGPSRAAYLLNPESGAGERPGYWAQPATTEALPDHWLAIGYGPDGTALGAALGGQITVPLNVGPDPTAATSAASSDDLAVDPGIRWMTDFDTAVTAGMGLRLFVDGGAAGTAAPGATTGRPTFSRLLVAGVRGPDASRMLADLLQAHHYTSGLELASYGTPTNNTSDAPSGFSSTDPGYANSYAAEVLAPNATHDAGRLAAAMGVAAATFSAAAAPVAPLMQQQDQQAMTALTWPATWGAFLTGFTGVSAATAEGLRSWAVAWLRPGGPLPALRIGARPYGILPVVDLAAWSEPSPAGAATHVHGVVTGLVGAWLSADPTAANPDFDSLLAREPVAAQAWGRFAGIMPGWLLDGFDLGVSHNQIETSISATLPGLLSQIGTACALGAPLTWPAGFVVLPDPLAPASPWPLVVPDGSMPWVAGASAPATYLAGLLAGTPPAATALLDCLALQSWNSMSGAGTGWTFASRGNLGDAPEPGPPSAVDELHASVSHLAGRTDADFSSLFGGAFDASAYRLDAWITALATSRLGSLRGSGRTGIFVGGFGWVENLVGRDPLAPASVPGEPSALEDPYNAGYQQAPSLQQATTAAVLRSGYLTHNPVQPGGPIPAPGAPFAIDLSSHRARLATWLLDGMRQGQPLSVLLGYRFERTLQEDGLGDLIKVFRQAAPYDPVQVDGSNGAGPTEAAVPTDVVDGVALYQLAQASPLRGPPTATQWAQAQPALTELAEAIDAVSDAVTAQGLHDLLTGSTYRAAATLDGVASGAVPPPELGFLNTVRTGIAVNHRVLLPIAPGQPSPPAGWPATPRGAAEPGLAAWIASLLGDPAQVTAAVTLLDPAGAPLPGAPTTIRLTSLALGPLDVVALASRPAELERLAVHSVISARPAGSPPASDGILDGSPAGAARPLSAVLTIAQSAGALIGAGRGADARDLAPAGMVSAPGLGPVGLNDLATRVTGVTTELTNVAGALSAALPADPVPGSPQAAGTGIPAGADPGVLAAALIQAVMLGIPAAAPAGTGTAALQALANQARGAQSEIVNRRAAIAALQPEAQSSDEATALAARLAQLAAAFGGGFRALPQVTASQANLLPQAAALTQAGTANPGQGADAWLVKASRVHAPVADLLDACRAAEALGTGPPLELTVAQLPLPAPATPGAAPAPVPWVGLPFTGNPPAANTLSLAMVQPPPAGTLSALLVADWVEVIPSSSETTGLTYHYAGPDAQAPQSILLAVPASLGTTAWTYGDLVNVVAAARDLAHIRGVDYADLPSAARQVLPAAYLANPPVPPPGPWAPVLPQLEVPGNHLAQAQGAIEISSVSVSGAPLEQGKNGQLVVTGASFAPAGQGVPPLPPSAFTVSGSGVTITGGTVSNSQATLTVAVDPQAETGPRAMTVGTFTLPGCLAIAPQPRATSCDTTRLSQGTAVTTQAITVTGQELARATVAAASGSALVTWQLTSVSAAQLQVTATIAASTYQPYLSPDGGGPVDKPIHLPPVHFGVGLTLTIQPAPGEPATAFPITLDAIE